MQQERKSEGLLDWEIRRVKEDMREIEDDISKQADEMRDVQKVLVRLTQRSDELNRLDDRVRILEEFRVATLESLKTLTETVKELKSSNVWLTRLFAGSLVTAIIGGIASMLQWLIQG